MEIEYKNVGRNEPCPCGSGKKFKRCHGENTPWQGNQKPEPAAVAASGDGEESSADVSSALGFDPSKMDLSWLAEFSSAIQRLPKGQLSQLQSLMQKAMSGKDVARELEELQRKLPMSVQELLQKSPALETQLESASQSAEPVQLTDDQREKLQEIQKNNEKAGLSKLWNRFKKK